MTVSSTTIKTAPYACDGATVQFAFSWKVWETSEVKVILRLASDGSETELSKGTAAGSYSVTLSTDTPSAGYITTVSTYSALYEIVIIANFPYTQEVDYGEGDKFPAVSHEEALDRGVRLSQQFTEKFGRAILFPESTTLEDIELPEISASVGGYFLGVNAAGSAIAWGEPTDLGSLTAHDTAASGSVHAELIADLVNNISTVSAGLALVATATEVATGNEATKIVSPSGLAAVFQYDTIQVPAGSLRPAVDNAGTQSIQEYPGQAGVANNEATTTRDYVELGGSLQGDESAPYDFTLILPDAWDQATLKAKAVWMATYDAALTVGKNVAIGFQIKAYNSSSPVTVNWSTPPIYVTDAVTNTATDVEEETEASANFASSIPGGSMNRLDIRVTRDSTITDAEVDPIWLTQLLFQFKRTNRATAW